MPESRNIGSEGAGSMTLKIVISGFGTVGQGVAEVLERKQDFIKRRFHRQVLIVAAFDSRSLAHDDGGLDPQLLLERKSSSGMVGGPRPSDMCRFLRETEFDVLVEVSPTNIETGGDGLLFIREALNKGAHVITVNKGPPGAQ
jgi:homoserine dehydrogenase